MNHIPTYRGSLKPEEVAEGMACALENAQRLTKDAQLLLDAGRYPSACSLGVLAIEEFGKLAILRLIALGGDRKVMNKRWKLYTNHHTKSYIWKHLSLLEIVTAKTNDLPKVNAELVRVVDTAKQAGFYTDCVHHRDWLTPETAISEETAQTIIAFAELFTEDKKSPTQQEVELWIRHMKPVCEAGQDAQSKALTAWFCAMTNEKLLGLGDCFMVEFVKNDNTLLSCVTPTSNATDQAPDK